MKKLLVLVVMAIFLFAGISFAQENLAKNVGFLVLQLSQTQEQLQNLSTDFGTLLAIIEKHQDALTEEELKTISAMKRKLPPTK